MIMPIYIPETFVLMGQDIGIQWDKYWSKCAKVRPVQ